MWLDAAVSTGVDNRVHVETVVRHELRQVADAVRHEADPETGAAQLFEHGQRVLEKLEVRRYLPALLDLGRTFGSDLLGTAHADENLGREAMPDRVVVQQLRMPLQVERSRLARRLVALDVERDALARRDARVAVGGQLWPRTAKREVDVEEDGAKSQAGAGQRYASGRRAASEGSRRRTSSSQARSSSALITVFSSGAWARTVPHGSTISERP